MTGTISTQGDGGLPCTGTGEPVQGQKSDIWGFCPELRTHGHSFIFKFESVQETTFQGLDRSGFVQVHKESFEIPQESSSQGRECPEEGVGERELFLRAGRMEDLGT